MRIGIMLRAYDRPGGIGIYCRNIVKHLLSIDRQNQYVLLYNNKEHVGTYDHLDNVEEVYLPSSNPFIWDQFQVPKVVKQKKIDLLFNTKFSLPLLTSVTKMMMLHGASWFVKPDLYKKADILYVRLAMPIYCKIADYLISNSDLTTRDFKRILKVPEKKIETVNLAPADSFVPVQDQEILSAVKVKYALPEKFILSVTSYDPRKNFSTLVKSFELCRREENVHLVIVGKDCINYMHDYKLDDTHLSQVIHFPGWVDQKDLPAIYSLAKVFFFPSVYEEFGIPVVEAMACGCPIVSSTTGAIPDLTQDSALLSDPFDAVKHADNILKILQSNQVATQLSDLGLDRAKEFSWDKAARQTLDIIRRLTTNSISPTIEP
ncbi:MAG: glycosyltransferase family 4 protein [Desulfobacteraceae bacterium]|nr:glycosyltransferase family 4 protein [Desulfobacteraceae bacterium]